MKILNWGCGEQIHPGWVNSDVRARPGVDLPCNIVEGLPVEDSSFDHAVSIHGLQDLPWPDIPKALSELHRVLRPGGCLRLAVPDLDRAIEAYRSGDSAYFYVPDRDARSVGAKLVTQIIWYGTVRTPFTFDYACEVLEDAGFTSVVRCAFRETKSGYKPLADLDNRERESLFMEARR